MCKWLGLEGSIEQGFRGAGNILFLDLMLFIVCSVHKLYSSNMHLFCVYVKFQLKVKSLKQIFVCMPQICIRLG